MTEYYTQQLKENGIPYKENVSLKSYTGYRTGGSCSLMILPETTEQAKSAFSIMRNGTLPWHVLGNGSNTLAPDDPGDDVYLCTSQMLGLSIEPTVEGGIMTADCGVLLSKAASEACKAGLSGLEFAHGIPGTVGGACVMNAGAYGSQISDIINATVYINREGRLCTVTGDEHCYGYRHSVFTPEDFLLSSSFLLNKRDPALIKADMDALMKKRRESQPLEYPSAGSVFKRPEGHFAGKLIEEAGLKGFRIGGAEVSTKHAGFIINTGGATSADILCLIAHIIFTVHESSGVTLEPEIRIIRKANGNVL